MKHLLYTFLAAAFILSCQRRLPQAVPAPPDAILEETRLRFAPDKRVALWDISAVETSGHTVWRGETNLPQARQYALQQAQHQGKHIIDSIQLLPSATLGADTFALVRQSVANLRTEARHGAEMATQALMGTPLRVFKKQGDWYLVQTPDGYIAWVDSGGLALCSEARMTQWRRARRVIFTGDYHLLYAPDGPPDAPLTDLVTGAILEVAGQDLQNVYVLLPDGRRGSLPIQWAMGLNEWLHNASIQHQSIRATAARFSGRPYLWGGSSAKGLDCSGFTKLVYFLHGYIIPRDASQQVHAGIEVPVDQTLSNLLPGDFLFFGSYRPDGSPKITHVGIYLGEGLFIHSGADNGCVSTQSLRPTDPGFAPHRLNTLLRARRLSPGTTQVTPIQSSGWY